MRVIAINTFHPPGLARPIMAGEVLEVDGDMGDVWIRQGLARALEADEKAIKAPAEQATRGPAEKAIRKPRAKRAS